MNAEIEDKMLDIFILWEEGKKLDAVRAYRELFPILYDLPTARESLETSYNLHFKKTEP